MKNLSSLISGSGAGFEHRKRPFTKRGKRSLTQQQSLDGSGERSLVDSWSYQFDISGTRIRQESIKIKQKNYLFPFFQISTREEISDLLSMEDHIDLIIPRGSNELVRNIQNQSQHIPVLGHAEGVCHVYVDRECNQQVALKIG